MNEATPAQIKQWKQTYKEIYQVDVPLDDEGTIGIGYVRKPDLDVIGASAKYAESDPIKSGNIMFESCWLGGDERITESEEAKLSATQKIAKLFKVRVSTIKKL